MKTVKSIYRVVAINLLSTLLLLIFINLILAISFSVKDAYQRRNKERAFGLFNSDGSPVDNGKRLQGTLERFDYDATMEVGEVAAAEVLDDFYDLSQRGFIYQPWTQFSEPPFQGKRVAVVLDERGFPVRRTANPPENESKPVVNIFTLGGSTTFGYYVSDEHTWPSYLAKALNARAEREGLNIQVKVTNHGHASYYPSQETALTIDLFRTGHRPNLVIFMDGINWGLAEDVPGLTPVLERGFDSMQHDNNESATNHLGAVLRKWVPMFRLATSIRQRLSGLSSASNSTAEQQEYSELSGDLTDGMQRLLERFEQHRKISKKICEEYGAAAMFFIQPDPSYNYPIGLFKRSTAATWRVNRKERQLFHDDLSQDPEFISLADTFNAFGVQQGRKAVLDNIHYTPAFNQFLADTVAARIDLKKLATSSSRPRAIATGTQRQFKYQ